MKQNIDDKTEGNISKYYSGEKFSPSDYLSTFSQEEKTRIFNDAYYCIGMFYRIIDDSKG
jgi:hypothetical protein